MQRSLRTGSQSSYDSGESYNDSGYTDNSGNYEGGNTGGNYDDGSMSETVVIPEIREKQAASEEMAVPGIIQAVQL